MSSMGRARALVGLLAIVSSGIAALGCDLLPGDDDAESQPAAVTDGTLPGCDPSDGAPADLRCTGLYADFGSKTLSLRARSFAPAVAFWSDGAEKERWIDLPDGAQIDTTAMDDWKFPVGTKVWKQFRAGGKLVETRFMQKTRADRWIQGAYVWSADETTATLQTDGATVDLGGGNTYVVPKSSECNDCHKGRKDKLLGFEAVSLGQPGASGFTLAALATEGKLSAPPAQTSVTIADDGTGHAAEALAWMHVNCGTSCHTGTSTATAYGTGLRLRIGWDEISGKPPAEWEIVRSTVGIPVKSPKWAGEVRITAGDPGASVVLKLLGQRGEEQMPPIATRVVDDKGKAAVAAWIRAMPKTTFDLPIQTPTE
ncbi:MAG: hypothetical protein JWP87_4673 [Labilithrix sp.]|nr:hypothetical protein [Labilithrix sp.]